ncbi:MAG: LysR family transcriptional regulator [Erysipelotrichaceae bacterium]|nr:LysR family transcriptional regulator [Erysipelotrichaceae bacterium]
MFRQVIYYFISVVEEGGFSAAGKKYYLSQSAISQQIRKLEDELGFALFDRSTYRPTLTLEGKKFYALSKKLINTYEKQMKNIQIHNSITIGITGPFEKKHLPAIIKRVRDIYDISYEVKKMDFLECVNELQNGTIDIGFNIVNNFENIENIIYYNIYKSHICVVTSLDHPLTSQKQLTIDDIKDEPIIVLSRKLGEHYYQDYMKAFELDGVTPHIIEEVDSLDDFLVSIQFGKGIGLSATEVVSSNDGVSTIPLENTHHQAYYAVGYRKDNKNEMVKSCIDIIVEYFKDYK